MKILPITDESIARAVRVIQDGGVVAHATETCYGLACDLTNSAAVEKLFRIKNRPFDQPVSALFSSVSEAKKYVEWNDAAEKLAKEYLPGPLTIVVSMQERMCHEIHVVPNAQCPMSNDQSMSNDQFSNCTIGLRVSSHPVAIKLAKLVGRPISTTSANLHGKPNPYSVEEIMEQYQRCELQPDLVLDSGELTKTPPSKIVDLTGDVAKTLRK